MVVSDDLLYKPSYRSIDGCLYMLRSLSLGAAERKVHTRRQTQISDCKDKASTPSRGAQGLSPAPKMALKSAGRMFLTRPSESVQFPRILPARIAQGPAEWSLRLRAAR